MSGAGSPQVRLANDIAAQFQHLPDAEGAAEVSAHITKFWDRRMIDGLLRRVDEGDGDLDPLVIAASTAVRAQLAAT